MTKSNLYRRGRLDPRVRYQVIEDRIKKLFLVWDTYDAKAVKVFKDKDKAEDLKNKRNNAAKK